MRKLSSTEVAIFISIFIHCLLFFLFSSFREQLISYEEIKEVSLIDPTYRPEVTKVLAPPKEAIGPSIPSAPVSVSSGGSQEEMVYDLTKKFERSQAKIDIAKFETGEELGAIRIADKIKGLTKTTEEILKEAPVPLTLGPRRGSSNLGITGYPGILEEPPIKLETRPIEPKREKIIERKPTEEIKILPAETKPGTITLCGPISERKILRKILPRYPEWALKKGISGAIVIRVWVTPEGDVKDNIEIVESCGYPDLDEAVSQALKGWKFAPLAENVKREVQWGLVTIRFELL